MNVSIWFSLNLDVTLISNNELTIDTVRRCKRGNPNRVTKKLTHNKRVIEDQESIVIPINEQEL